MESISHNVNRKEADLKFYEFGKVYSFDPTKESTAEKPLSPYSENENLALWMTGNMNRASWNVKAVEASVYDLKGILMNIFSRAGISEGSLKFEQGSDEIFAAKLDISFKSGKHLAEVGILRSSVLKKFDIEQSVVYAAVDWTALFRQARKTDVKYAELPKTQGVERDLALLVDKNVKFAEIEEVIRKTEKKLLRDVRLFDVYEGKNLPAGKKSYAVSMKLQDMEKTLNDKQIEATMNKIINALQTFGAELREEKRQQNNNYYKYKKFTMGRAFEYRKARKLKRWGNMRRTFTRIGKEITIAVKAGGPDPDMNPRLRVLMQNAKAANMPKDTVERAIKKATDKDAGDYKEIVYEGYGPFGIAIVVETATDNNQRTVANVRSYFNKFGGSLGTQGSLSFLFDHKSVFHVKPNEGMDHDEFELELMDFEAELETDEEEWLIYGAFDQFANLQKYLEDKGMEIVSAEFERIPTDYKEVTPEQREQLDKLLDKFEDDEDVQNVFHNIKED